MVSAIQLTATSTLINGQGLDSSHTLAANIVALQTQTPVTTLVNIISLINAADANIRGNLLTSISNIGVGVTTGHGYLICILMDILLNVADQHILTVMD